MIYTDVFNTKIITTIGVVANYEKNTDSPMVWKTKTKKKEEDGFRKIYNCGRD